MSRRRLFSRLGDWRRRWRQAIAREHQHVGLEPEMSASEIAETKSVRWRDALTASLTEFGKTHADLTHTAKGAIWKIAVVRTLGEPLAPCRGWLAENLCVGKAASMRSIFLGKTNDQRTDPVRPSASVALLEKNPRWKARVWTLSAQMRLATKTADWRKPAAAVFWRTAITRAPFP